MYLIELPERFLYHLEAIDIENGEYLFCDSTGAGVCVSVSRGVIERVAYGDQAVTLPQHLRLTLRLSNFSCLGDNLHSILEEVSSPNFR